MKIVFFIFCLIVLSQTISLRFKDFEQLQKHHNHDQKLFKSSNIIRVHIFPHSHDDVGWLKTVDEYYFGEHNDIQWAGVQYIIDSYMTSLILDPTKRFIQVETAFFKKWWDQQTPLMQQKVKELVKNKQLEFISGGWCMNDEATPYYEDIIDQMTLGHKFLLDTFEVKPTIGWQIDPFGHQSTQAAFSSLMGFNAWFFSRIDYQDKEQRLQNKEMEMVMRPHQQSGEDNSIFTHVQYYHYEAPPDFNFNDRRNTEPIIEDKKSKDYNLEERAQQLVYYFQNETIHYRGNIISHTFGSDFEWDAAPIFFKNLDKLMNYINTNKDKFNMELLYSTPSQYLEEINQQKEIYPTKDDDFFPYADEPNAYWTGYFSSRVAIKGITKQAGRYTQTIRRFISTLMTNHQSQYVNNNKLQILEDINQLEEAMGILQHHDAVSGTARQHVTDDYILILCEALFKINSQIDKILGEISQETIGESSTLQTCNWNITSSECGITYQTLKDYQPVIITILESKVSQNGQLDKIRVKVPRLNLQITNQFNQPVVGDVICSDFNNLDNCDLYFLYEVGHPIQYFKIYPVQETHASAKLVKPENLRQNFQSDNEIHVQLGDAPQFSMNYGYYRSYQVEDDQKSGAYIFRPEGAAAQSSQYGKPIQSMEFKGKIVHVLSIQGTLYDTTIRNFDFQLYENAYEVESYIHSIPIDDGVGKEVVILFNTNIHNNDIFYTDSNGLELQKRKLNYRPTWDLQVMEPSSGNYYPINGMILLEDADNGDAVAILNDRSQGGTSLKEGQIEIMIHRRLLKDDDRGVWEPLNERNPDGTGLEQRINHQITFFNKKSQPNHHRKLQLYVDQPAYTYFSKSQITNFNLQRVYSPSGPLHQLLKHNENKDSLVKIYFQPYLKGTFIFRVQNFQESGEINLQFPEGYEFVETTLTANQALLEWQDKRMAWNIENGDTLPKKQKFQWSNTVKPLQIRTFIIVLNQV